MQKYVKLVLTILTIVICAVLLLFCFYKLIFMPVKAIIYLKNTTGIIVLGQLLFGGATTILGLALMVGIILVGMVIIDVINECWR